MEEIKTTEYIDVEMPFELKMVASAVFTSVLYSPDEISIKDENTAKQVTSSIVTLLLRVPQESMNELSRKVDESRDIHSILDRILKASEEGDYATRDTVIDKIEDEQFLRVAESIGRSIISNTLAIDVKVDKVAEMFNSMEVVDEE